MVSVILLQPESSGNIGFIARAMANFGLNQLILIEPLCSHLDNESIKKSMHAHSILKNAVVKDYNYFMDQMRDDFDLVIGSTSITGNDYNLPRTPIYPWQLPVEIFSQKAALIFGNEGRGLSNIEIGKCDFIVNIPTSGGYRALNISHAAAIIFYELFRKRDAGISKIRPATRAEKERILSIVDSLVEKSRFSTSEKIRNQKIVWRKVFERAMLSKREAFAVMGLLRKLDRKL